METIRRDRSEGQLMSKEAKFAVVLHGRWLETDEPLATVIYSRDGRHWHDICTCAPEWANEICDALDVVNNRTLDD